MPRSRRAIDGKKGYHETGKLHPKSYTPSYRTRKAPKAYWCRKPLGYGETEEQVEMRLREEQGRWL